jgi:hypothetical protein
MLIWKLIFIRILEFKNSRMRINKHLKIIIDI